jgi:hypothetical protein
MSHNNASASQQQQPQSTAAPAVTPQRLELSLNPEDGSLLTSPLLSVLLSSTDGLYSDLYHMAHGELEVTTAQQKEEDDEDNNNNNNNNTASGSGAAPSSQAADNFGGAAAPPTARKERMSNLSFAQRRHELAWRLAQHGKTLTHVAALTAAAASSDSGTTVKVSTKALQHARTAWVQADEAQDALYFFHAQLFPARQAPHDVYGALDTLQGGTWKDMPSDLQLLVDRYQTSQEKTWSSQETADRWHMAVRDKLLRGEVGWMRRNALPCSWNIRLRGGIMRLTHGTPKIHPGNASQPATTVYPLEAVLTVLSTNQPSEWTLLSIAVHAQAKTGESNHQLDTTNRQRYDLHRLCALSMAKEEARQRKEEAEAAADNDNENEKDNDSTTTTAAAIPTVVARPLHGMFQVAHMFGLSWQLEIISAQAQALRKGVFAEGASNPIVVTPVQFLEKQGNNTLGMVSISFWSVDDRYGPPCMGDLSLEHDDNENDNDKEPSTMKSTDSVSTSVTAAKSAGVIKGSGQLTLSVRAEPNVGIRVSLSGAESIMEFASVNPHIRLTIQQLLEATSDPFCLSASEALLAATRLCAERKCHAMVQALLPTLSGNTNTNANGGGTPVLPPWITLEVERGSIAVAARVQYYGMDANGVNNPPVFLFRLACDSRTGSFVPTFSKSARLLQLMVCNDLKATESTAIRIAALAKHRRRMNFSSGRAVRDAFDGLSRSMNVLGQRTGVGGAWNDTDRLSASLRQRATHVACQDVRVSLITCCGMAALYGLSAIAIGVATGVAASPDMAGGNVDTLEGISFLPAPPVSLLVDQQLVEKSSVTTDGEKKKQAYTEQELFGISCSVDGDALTLYGTEMKVQLDTPSAGKFRTFCLL